MEKMQTVTMSELAGEKSTIFDDFFFSRVPMLMLGMPGIGKTEIIVQKCAELLKPENSQNTYEENDGINYYTSGTESVPGFFSIDMSAIPADGLMMPYLDNTVQGDNADHLKRDIISEMKALKLYLKKYPKNVGIFFIDELTSANQDDQRTLMNFVNSGLLPDGDRIDVDRVWFILAGNPSADMPGYEDYDGATNSIEEAVITRGGTFYVKADIDSFLEWGRKLDSRGLSNIHPYLIAALSANRDLLNKRVEDDNRVLNSRTAKKLTEYFYAAEERGHRWSSAAVRAFAGDSVGSTLCATISHLDHLVDIKKLFGKDSSKELDEKELAKFVDSQPFEQFYTIQSATNANSPISFKKANNMIKLRQLLTNCSSEETSLAFCKTLIENEKQPGPAKDIMSTKWITKPETNIQALLVDLNLMTSQI